MATGHGTQLTRQIGEHLVVAKLGRMGFYAAPFAGNVPFFDLIASDSSGKSIPIQVKTINEPSSWQFNASAFLEIEINGNVQKLKGKKKLADPALTCVLINLRKNEQEDFYICELSFLQDYFFDNYRCERPKNPKSLHCAIKPKALDKFKSNWGLITKTFGKA